MNKSRRCSTCGGMQNREGGTVGSGGYIDYDPPCPECDDDPDYRRPPCSLCRGSGEVHYDDGHHGHYGHSTTCPKCKGTGR